MRPGSDCENVHCDLHHGHEGPHLNAHGPAAGSDSVLADGPDAFLGELKALYDRMWPYYKANVGTWEGSVVADAAGKVLAAADTIEDGMDRYV